MSEEEKKQLTKEAYIEMARYVKDELEEMRDWLQSNFVCATHCLGRENRINQKFLLVLFGIVIVGAIAGIDNILPIILRVI